MIDRALRVPKQKLFRPLVRRWDQSPLWITVTALAVGLAAAVAAALAAYALALGLWLLSRLLDGLDSEVARNAGRQSDLGGYLDMLGDLAVYAALPIGLAVSISSQAVWLALALLLASFYLNVGSWMMLSALLEKRRQGALKLGERTSITMPVGLIEGAETVILFTLFLLFPEALVPLFGLTTGLVLVSAPQRVIRAVRTLRR